MNSSSDKVVVCDVSALPADLRTLELLTRLHLTARRFEGRVRFEHASPALKALVDFCGLGDTLALSVNAR